MAVTHTSGALDLGNLEPGDTTFRFTVHGQLVQAIAFTVTDNDPPRASLNAPDLREVGGRLHCFTVTSTDIVAVAGATRDSRDILVTGPRGFEQPATFVRADRTEDGRRWAATYQISAPNGEWTASDARAYTISAPAENALLDVLARDVAAAYATVTKLWPVDALFSLPDDGLSTM